MAVSLLAMLSGAATVTAKSVSNTTATREVVWTGNGTTSSEGGRTLTSEECDEDGTPYLLWVLAGSKATEASISINEEPPISMEKANGPKKGASTFKYLMTSESPIDLDDLESVTATYNDGKNKATLTISHGCLGGEEEIVNGVALLIPGLNESVWSEGGEDICVYEGDPPYEGYVAACETFLTAVRGFFTSGATTVDLWLLQDDSEGVPVFDAETFVLAKLTSGTFVSQGNETPGAFLNFGVFLFFAVPTPADPVDLGADFIRITYDETRYRYLPFDDGGGGGGGGGCSSAPVPIAGEPPVVTYESGVLSATTGGWQDVPGCTNTYTFQYENPVTFAGVTQSQTWEPPFPGVWCDVYVIVRATNEPGFSETATSATIQIDDPACPG